MAVDSTGNELRERPIGELLKQLSQETTTLVKQELDLAKAEMTQQGKRAGLVVGTPVVLPASIGVVSRP